MEKIRIIPFDLSLATDDNIFTKSGHKIRILCTNAKGDFPIVALLSDDECDVEVPYTYTIQGNYSNTNKFPSSLDLELHIPENSVNTTYSKIEELAKELNSHISEENSSEFNKALTDAMLALNFVKHYF